MKQQKTRVFNLAFNLSEFVQNRSPNSKSNLIFSHDNRSNNIFIPQKLQKQNIKQIKDNQKYKVVGFRQLKNLQEKMRKMSKEKRRDTFHMSFIFSRNSNQGIEQSEFLSKEAVRKMHQSRSKQVSKRQEPSEVIMVNKNVKNDMQGLGNIGKIALSFKKHKSDWQSSVQRSYKGRTLPKIYDYLQNNRQKMLNKEINELRFKKENINARMWTTVLRSQLQLKNLYNKQPMIVQQNELKLKGKSKRQEEDIWVSSMSQSGYRFKLYEKSK